MHIIQFFEIESLHMKLLCYSFSCWHSLRNYCNRGQLSLSQSSRVRDRTWGNFFGIHPDVVYYIKIGIHAAVNHSGSRQHVSQFGYEVPTILVSICWFESVLSTYFYLNVSWRDFYVIFRNWSNACFNSLQKLSPDSSLLSLVEACVFSRVSHQRSRRTEYDIFPLRNSFLLAVDDAVVDIKSCP